MIDINLIRENSDIVKLNLKKKFQEDKILLVDEIKDLDKKNREVKIKVDELRRKRNEFSDNIGIFYREGKKNNADELKEKVVIINNELVILEKQEEELKKKLNDLMMQIPNIIDNTVPIGKDENDNVELKKYGKPKEFDYDIPYHIDILESLEGIDLDSARKISGNGFYYLMGDIARLHSAILSYARDFMINKEFKYVIPPFMIRSEVVKGVMSFEEMDNMMYKIEDEDLYLVGTSEHSMIGAYIDSIIPYSKLPLNMTSYSSCFRKEKGAHGIEERGIYRIHQFEKQEMIVICKPEDSKKWFEKLYNYTIEFFTLLDIPVRILECCSGDLGDLKSKSIDVEAWSPRQKKYFEVGSCSNLTAAQSRRLGIRSVTKEGNKFYPHTLNNTVVASPRAIIALLENNYNKDGSITIPKVLRPYMGGKEQIVVEK